MVLWPGQAVILSGWYRAIPGAVRIGVGHRSGIGRVAKTIVDEAADPSATSSQDGTTPTPGAPFPSEEDFRRVAKRKRLPLSAAPTDSSQKPFMSSPEKRPVRR